MSGADIGKVKMKLTRSDGTAPVRILSHISGSQLDHGNNLLPALGIALATWPEDADIKLDSIVLSTVVYLQILLVFLAIVWDDAVDVGLKILVDIVENQAAGLVLLGGILQRLELVDGRIGGGGYRVPLVG